ncbi:MAG: ribbon-helix-helix domain-containing protein [Rhodospirillales bacterium]|jgi:predicted DNA-binding ribbon-helix-helix protein
MVDQSAASAIRKRSVLISGHRTSISLEEAFWTKLKELCDEREKSINQLVTEIDNDRLDTPSGNLSSAIRVYILEQLEAK